MLAEWKDKKVCIGDNLHVVKRGQLIVSVSYLQERWKYHRLDPVTDRPSRDFYRPSARRILNFLKMLEQEGMITRNAVTVKYAKSGTVVTICNYESYQAQTGTPDNGCDNGCDKGCDKGPDKGPDKGLDNEYEEYKEKKEYKERKNIERKMPNIFQKPTLEEIRIYVEEKGYAVDAERFFNFYESKGWMVGKNKMKNWHAAVSTWQKSTDERNESYRRQRENRRGEAGFTATCKEDYSTTF